MASVPAHHTIRAIMLPFQTTLLDVVEDALQRRVDEDLVARTHQLTLPELRTLKQAYDDYAASFVLNEPPTGEFWPLSLHLLNNSHLRSPRVADAVLRRALAKLLYAHGAFASDPLGNYLSHMLHPYGVSREPAWVGRPSDRDLLANYFETLAYVRPLCESGLLVLVPRRTVVLFDDIDTVQTDADAEDRDAELLAIELVHGLEARTWWENQYLAGKAFGVPSAMAHTIQDIGSVARSFQSLMRKFEHFETGAPGELSFELAHDAVAFDFLLKQALPPRHGEAARLAVVERASMPHITDLQPADVVALHQSETWVDYRGALRRGLRQLADMSEESMRQTREAVRDELKLVEHAAQRTTARSKFLNTRRDATRDMTISAIVLGGLSPAIGPKAVGFGLAGSWGRSAVGLLWSWLRAHRDETDASLVRCFAAFSETSGVSQE